ncbi:MAG: hypothetical protein ACE5DK_03140 [Paracoccaceae bacterium]
MKIGKIFALISGVLLWPGKRLVAFFPQLGDAERRLLHNVANYVVWLALLCGMLIYTLIVFRPAT